MSFFSTPVKALTPEHLLELVGMRAQENVRLEFKREQVDRDEHLKKVSSFANTMGGRIIYGIEQDKEGRALRLTGVDRDDAFESQLTSWCAHYLHETLIPEVSAAIPIAGTTKVAYVVDVEESELAPHFLEGRKGCFVRTNEGSHRFEARPADLSELRALLNRREESRARALALKKRSEDRGQKRLGMLRDTLNTWAPWVPFTCRAALRFPLKPLAPASDIARIVKEASFEFDATPFPHAYDGVYSQAESLILSKPRHELLSLLEVTTFGSVTYTDFMQADGKYIHTDFPGAKPISMATVPIGRALGAAHLAAKFAGRYLERIGARGGVVLTLLLRDVRGIGFLSQHPTWSVAAPFLDEAIEISHEIPAGVFVTEWKSQLHALWRDLYFALGWKDAHRSEGTAAIAADLGEAYRFYNLKPGVLD